MCEFFSFVTEPEKHPNEKFYFDWEYRKNHLKEDGMDSHDHICKVNGFTGDNCNKYEYNPLTKVFNVDQINSSIDDRIQAEVWVKSIDFKKIVEPLIIKNIINPLELNLVKKPTKAQIGILYKWASVGDSVVASVVASVRASVWDSVWASVWASVGDSVGDSVRDSVVASVRASVWDSVWASVRDSVWASVRDSVVASVGAYTGSFFDIKYNVDITSHNKLWESGLVPSFDGTTWRLHSGKNAQIVYEIKAEDLRKLDV